MAKIIVLPRRDAGHDAGRASHAPRLFPVRYTGGPVPCAAEVGGIKQAPRSATS